MEVIALIELLTEPVLDKIRSAMLRHLDGRTDLPAFVEIVSAAIGRAVDPVHRLDDPTLLAIIALFERADRDGLGNIDWHDVTTALLPQAGRGASTARSSVSNPLECKGHVIVPRPAFDTTSPFTGRVVQRARVFPALGAVALCFQDSDELGMLRLTTAWEVDVTQVHTLGVINISATTGPVPAMPPASHARKDVVPLDAAYIAASKVLVISANNFTLQFWDVSYLLQRIQSEAIVAGGGTAAVAVGVDAETATGHRTARATILNERYARFVSAVHVPVPHHHIIWVPDAHRLLGATAYGDMQVWHAFATRKTEWQLPELRVLHRGTLRIGYSPIVDMVLLAELGMVAAGSVDGNITLWGVQGLPDGYGGRRGAHADNMNAHSFRVRARAAGGVFYLKSLTRMHAGGLRSFAYVASVRKLVSVGEDDWAQVYDMTINEGTPSYRLLGHTVSLAAVTIIEPSERDSLEAVHETSGASDASQRLARLRYLHHAHAVSMDISGELRWWTLSRNSGVLDTERCLQVLPPHPLRSWRAGDAARFLINMRQLTHEWLYEQERTRLLEALEHEADASFQRAAADGALADRTVPGMSADPSDVYRQRTRRITYDESCIMVVLGPRWLAYEAVSLHAMQLPVTAVLYHSLTQRMIAVSDRSLRWYDGRTGELVATSEDALPANCCARAAVVGAGGKRLIFGLIGGNVVVLDPYTGVLLRTCAGHNADISGLCYCDDESILISAGFDGEVHVIDDALAAALEHTAEGALMTPAQRRDKALMRIIKHAHGFGIAICALAYNHQQALIATAAVDGTIRIWDYLTLRLTSICVGHDAIVTALVWPDDLPVCVSADRSGVVNVWHCPRVGPAGCRASFTLYKADISLIESGLWMNPPHVSRALVRRTSLCVAGTLQACTHAAGVKGSDARQPSIEPSVGGHIVDLMVLPTADQRTALIVADRLGQVSWWDLTPILQRLTPQVVMERLSWLAERELTPPPTLPWLSYWDAPRIRHLSDQIESLPVHLIGYNPRLNVVVDARGAIPMPLAAPLVQQDIPAGTSRSRNTQSPHASPLSVPSYRALTSTASSRPGVDTAGRFTPSSGNGSDTSSATRCDAPLSTEFVQPTVQSWMVALLTPSLQRVRAHGTFSVADLPAAAGDSVPTAADPTASPVRDANQVASDVSERVDAVWEPLRVRCTTPLMTTDGMTAFLTAGDDGALNAYVQQVNARHGELEWRVVGHIGIAGGKPSVERTAVPIAGSDVRITHRDGWSHVCGKRDAWRLDCVSARETLGGKLRTLAKHAAAHTARVSRHHQRHALLESARSWSSGADTSRQGDDAATGIISRHYVDTVLASAPLFASQLRSTSGTTPQHNSLASDHPTSPHIRPESRTTAMDFDDAAAESSPPITRIAQVRALSSPAEPAAPAAGSRPASPWKVPGLPLDEIMARTDEATLATLQTRAKATVKKGMNFVRVADADRGMSTGAMLKARNPALMRRLSQLRHVRAASSSTCMSMSEDDIRAVASGERSRDRSHIEQAIEDDRRQQRLARAIAVGVLADLSSLAAAATVEPKGAADAPSNGVSEPTASDATGKHRGASKMAVLRAASKWTKLTLQNRLLAPVIDVAAQAPASADVSSAPLRTPSVAPSADAATAPLLRSRATSASAAGNVHTRLSRAAPPKPAYRAVPMSPDEWLWMSRKALIGGQLRADVTSFTTMIKALRAHETDFVALDVFLQFVQRSRSRLNSMRKQLELLFRGVDDRGKGILPLSEFTRVIFPKASEEQVDTILRFALYEGPSVEAIQVDYIKRCKPETVELLQQLFDVYDKDGSGCIDRDELTAALRAMKAFSSNEGGLTHDDIAEQVDVMMRTADTSGDGEVSFDEFLVMMGPHFIEA